jgi:hypothetical protein
MAVIVYTKEEMKTLKTMVAPEGVYDVYLEEFDYDPEKFAAFVKKHVPKEYHILYEATLEELAEMLDDRSIKGLINFRFTIGR